MKKYFKKFSIMFAMAIAIMLGYSANAFAADQTIKINNTTLNFNKVIYVSAIGNDTTGDGSQGNPFLTFDKAYQNSTDNSAIVLGDGTFASANYFANIISTKNISIIGNGSNTILTFPGMPDAHFAPTGNVYLYKLTIKASFGNYAFINGDSASPCANIYMHNVMAINQYNQYFL